MILTMIDLSYQSSEIKIFFRICFRFNNFYNQFPIVTGKLVIFGSSCFVGSLWFYFYRFLWNSLRLNIPIEPIASLPTVFSNISLSKSFLIIRERRKFNDFNQFKWNFQNNHQAVASRQLQAAWPRWHLWNMRVTIRPFPLQITVLTIGIKRIGVTWM